MSELTGKSEPVSEDEHYKRLNVYPADPVVGEKWEITKAIYWHFLEILPPLGWNGASFYMCEFCTRNITAKYSREGDRYFCEWSTYPPSQKEGLK